MKLKNELKDAIKAKDELLKNTIRLIMGELARKDKKEFSDDEIISIIRKMIKNEKETLSANNQETSDYLSLLETYIPKQVSEEEIIDWIKDNIDFTSYKNKMQAMGPIMKHFGTTAEGNTVKQILLKNF
jgi:uncharacterized protein YqeY